MAGKRNEDGRKEAIALAVPFGTAPMEAEPASALPRGPEWQYEPKWDGFRCLAYRDRGAVALQAKSGKPLTRYFPEIAALLLAVAPLRFVLDGELVVEAEGEPSFDALQMRIHPAESRIRRLAAETPARLVVFDLLLGPDGRSLLDETLADRRAALEAMMQRIGNVGGMLLSPATTDARKAAGWLARSGSGAFDGVVAKRNDAPYTPGERTMVKVKRRRTADCVVGGFRYGEDSKEVASLLLGLYNDRGELDHVGFTSSIAAAERQALTRKLEALVEPPGFTGKAPGAPSRWSTARSSAWEPLRPELVVEVRFDQVTGARMRHGATLLRWRADKAPRQCTLDQILPAKRRARRSVASASHA